MRTKTPSFPLGSTPLGQSTSSQEAYHLQEDQSLLAWVFAGDQQAFAALFDRLAPQALGLARRICNNRVLAEDAVQDAFLSIWQGAARFDGRRGSVRAYVFSAVHNKAVDAIRHEASLRRRDEVDTPAESTGDDPVGEETWINIRRSEVRSALARLSEVQREALELAYFGGLSYREVAGHLGIPVGTAKTRLRDGLRQLRVALRDLQDPAT